MTEEVEIGVADDVYPIEQSSLQASDGEALISSLLKTRTMMAEEEEIGVSVEIEPQQSWLHIPNLMKEFEFEDFMNLGSSYDKKAHEIDEGDNGSVDEVEVAVPQTPRKRRENRRFDCKALLEFKLNGDKYHVIQFMSEHTHDLVPPQSAHYLRSQRGIEFSQVGLIVKMHSSGFKQSDIYSYMSTEAGGPQYLNFIPSDCYNLIRKKRAGFLKKGDSQCLLEYFKQKTQENKHFFYSFRTTNENEVRGVFFCDAKPRRDYGLFGDAICFDTTFRTNNYDMLCAPIVGISNHGISNHGQPRSLDVLFRDLQYESLPPRYYLKRWTRTIVDEDVFDLHRDLIPNDTDPSLTIRYSGLSQISQRIVSKGSKFPDVSSLTEVGLLELEAKVESWISSRSANQNVVSNTQNSSTLNVDDEAPLRDPTKRQRRCQGGKGENSTTKAMTRSKPLKEVEEDENAHDTTSTQGPYLQPSQKFWTDKIVNSNETFGHPYVNLKTEMSKCPGIYNDIGKKARDLLYKDYYTQQPPIHHYNDRNLAWRLDLAGQISDILPGLRTACRFIIPYQNEEDTMHVFESWGDRIHESKPFDLTGISLAENSLLNFSAVTGNSLLSLGADLSFIPATRQLDKYNAGLSFNIAILNASLTLNDMGDKLRASCYSSINPLTKTAIAVELNHQFSRNETTLTFGAQHAIFPITLVKARASSDGKLGALIQQQLFPSFYLTIAGDVDTQHSVKGVTTRSKLGMSLAFRS
ncbi:hypothetical protein RHSIM_Rhsim08G0159600 [Rhododendron simsii]|uniref:Protein FAR1-RELATED SEQUENCE n=1 Tax=Rhododendron simsii TaxID=118357 RepID=A0A834LGX1_RHOSS|nr:hypothetical protein RHSIM_Rhsim08G0159600 [Rhododendron simsii]